MTDQEETPSRDDQRRMHYDFFGANFRGPRWRCLMLLTRLNLLLPAEKQAIAEFVTMGCWDGILKRIENCPSCFQRLRDAMDAEAKDQTEEREAEKPV